MPQPGHFELGVQGLALLRLWMVGQDDTIRDRFGEIAALMQALEGGPFDLDHVPELGIAEGYDRWSETYENGGNPIVALEEPAVRALLAEIPPGKAVDVACGTGRHLEWLLALSHDATGVDLSSGMLRRARNLWAQPLLCNADVRSLPFPAASFDLAVCALALTHLATLEPAVNELARVVRPGGRVILSDVHPFATMVGTQAGFRTSGGSAFVRNWLHLHGDYLQAFAGAGLVVRRCIEPVVGETEIAMIAGEHARSAPGAPGIEAYRAAFLGLPAILIWDLERT